MMADGEMLKEARNIIRDRKKVTVEDLCSDLRISMAATEEISARVTSLEECINRQFDKQNILIKNMEDAINVKFAQYDKIIKIIVIITVISFTLVLGEKINLSLVNNLLKLFGV